MKRICFVYLLAGLLPAVAERYQIRRYGSERGLPAEAAVRCLHQDRQGFLWAGGSDGLFRWLGDRFEKIDSPALTARHILAMAESRDGVLWLGTDRGLLRYRPAENIAEKIEMQGWADTALTSLAFDGRQNLYAGTPAGLLLGVPEGKTFRFSLKEGSQANGPATGLHSARTGRIWFWCGPQVCSFADGAIQTYAVPRPSLPPVRAFLASDQAGLIWATDGKGLFVLLPGSDKFQTSALGRPGEILTLGTDRDGNLLAGLTTGMVRRASSEFAWIDPVQGQQTPGVSAMLQDANGSLWLGFTESGMARIPGFGQWRSWSAAEGIAGPVLAAAQDNRDALWSGNESGLARLLPGQTVWQRWGIPGRARVRIDSLAATPEGVIWAGSSEGLLARIQPSVGTTFLVSQREGLGDIQVRQLAADAEGRLWVLTQTGLYRSRPNGKIAFEQIAVPPVKRMALGGQGRVWLASDRLYAVNASGTVSEAKAAGLPPNLEFLATGGESALWLASSTKPGVWRLNLDSGEVKGPELGEQSIRFLGSDRKGRVFAGTPDGVLLREANRWRRFDAQDGLSNPDCSPHGFARTAGDSVLIAGRTGLSEFRIAPVEVSGPPAVHILSARFTPETKSFHAWLAAPSTLSDTDLRYRYRLKGLEDSWNETRSREVRYTMLPGGAYMLEVQTAGKGGGWSEPAATYAVTVPLPWWNTLSFRIGSVASIGVLLFLLWQRKRLKDQARDIRATDADRTQAQELEKARKELEELQRKAAHTESEARQLREELAKTRKPAVPAQAPIRLRELLHGILLQVSARAAQKGIAVSSRISADVPDAVEASPVSLKPMLSDLVTEAISRTPSGEVVLHATLEGGQLRFTVRHGGEGGLPVKLQGSAAQDGIGLASERGAFHCFVKAVPAAAAGRALRVLLAEDNEINQQLIRKLLEKKGCTVTGVTTGVQALAEIGKQEFDLALLDVQMPEMGGFEATRKIREHEQVTGKHLRILGLSSSPLSIERERCLTAGMDGYIRKPILAADFYAAIEQSQGQPAG